MTDNQKYFLVVAEELNITKAAKRLYVSQQCISNHIQRMEEIYHVKLFERRPKLALTAAGRAVERALCQVQIIENSLAEELNEMNSELTGTINLGIVRARVPVLVPNIITEYKRNYPNVTVNVNNDYTDSLESQIINGKQDVFIGISNNRNKTLRYVPLAEERVFLVISDKLFRTFFQSDYQQTIEKFLNGVEFSQFQHVPFVLNTNGEGLYRDIEKLAKSTDMELNILFQSDDPFVRLKLCQEHFCASIFPEMTLRNVVNLTQEIIRSDQLHYFPFRQACMNYHLVLAYHRNAFLPEYRKRFIQIATDVSRTYKASIIPQ